MRFILIPACLLFVVSAAWSQQGADPFNAGSADPFGGGTSDPFGAGAAVPVDGGAADPFGESPVQARRKQQNAAPPNVANPFDAMNRGMEMMDMGGMGMEMNGADMSGMMGMGMGMGTGMGGFGPSSDQLFREGLQRAIVALKKAKTEEEKEVLRGYVRVALEGRYSEMISQRKRDLEKLKASVAKLESDLKRRESAKDRVVQVQMQSVQLAAEGLLELGELQGVAGGQPGSGGSGYGGMDEGGGDGDN